MNCANHPQNSVAAYCRTCGKPLCSDCTRQVMGVVYCENCLAERVAGTAPPVSAFQPAPGYVPRPRPTGAGPNPGLAGFLGAIPFGVGAIYNGQYTKGLVHLGIFVGLVVSLSSDLPGYWYPILGIGMAFFVVYQIIDAVHTARAIQSGRPAPDPLGLTNMFSPGERPAEPVALTRSNVPTGAVVLIGLGVLFLLHNLISLKMGVLGPLILIGLGVWLLTTRCGPGSPRELSRRRLMGPAILITLGVQFLLENLGIISFGRTLPVLLIVIGVILAIQRTAANSAGPYPPPRLGDSNIPPTQPHSEVNSEVKNG
jgi:B-box zinc finger